MSPALAPAGLAFAKATLDSQKEVLLGVGRHFGTSTGLRKSGLCVMSCVALGGRPGHSGLSFFFYGIGMKVLSPEVTGRIGKYW